MDAIGRDRSLWKANSQTQRKLIILPTHKGSSPAGVGSPNERRRMRQCSSTLHYARNMRWTSQSLLAATTARPVMGGSSWTTLRHEDERVRQAFALWANSTLGMMAHWTQGQRTQTGRARTQIAALKKIPCPRLDSLSSGALNRAAADFSALANRELQPACQAHADNVRKAVDEAAIRLLGLGDDAANVVGDLRLLWCSEPSVHAYNKKALDLLELDG